MSPPSKTSFLRITAAIAISIEPGVVDDGIKISSNLDLILP